MARVPNPMAIRSLALAALAAGSICPVLAAQVSQSPGAQPRRLVTGTALEAPGFVVALHDQADLDALTQDWGVLCVGSTSIGATFELQAPTPTTTAGAAQLLGLLEADPRVRFAEPAMTLRAPESTGCLAPPETVSGLPCTISFYDGDPAPEKFYDQPLAPIIDLGPAQGQLTGTPTIVAVIDTGIDPTHPLFAGRLASPGFDFLLGQVGAFDLADGLDNDLDGLADEAAGHGTHVAGTIVLVNPDAKILPLRVLDSDGNGKAFDVAQAIYFALESGAQVINLSLGMAGESEVVAEALALAHAMDVDVYAAAGNTGALGVSFPASHPAAFAVTAVNDQDVKAPFASFGPEVDVAAPGVKIYSAMPGDAWAWWSGTSMATAVVSGLGSMVHSVDPEAHEVPDGVADGAEDIEHENPGFHHLLGEGRIDAWETLEKVLDLDH